MPFACDMQHYTWYCRAMHGCSFPSLHPFTVYILVIYCSQSLNIKSGTLEKEQVVQAIRGHAHGNASLAQEQFNYLGQTPSTLLQPSVAHCRADVPCAFSPSPRRQK